MLSNHRPLGLVIQIISDYCVIGAVRMKVTSYSLLFIIHLLTFAIEFCGKGQCFTRSIQKKSCYYWMAGSSIDIHMYTTRVYWYTYGLLECLLKNPFVLDIGFEGRERYRRDLGTNYEKYLHTQKLDLLKTIPIFNYPMPNDKK